MSSFGLASGGLRAVRHKGNHVELFPATQGNGAFEPLSSATVLPVQSFSKILVHERKRTDRSGKPFLLLLVDLTRVDAGRHRAVADQVISALSNCLRETDLVGWYEADQIVGAVLTEIGRAEREAVACTIQGKVTQMLRSRVRDAELEKIAVSFHFYPEDEQGRGNLNWNSSLYPDLNTGHQHWRTSQIVKRVIDVLGSLLLLLFSSPLFLLTALAVKLTSKGPVFFRQQRVGQFGKVFSCLKFRSMHTNCDPRLHQAYIEKFISRKTGEQNAEAGGELKQKGLFKIVDDPRVTRLGSFLRKSSLDELPQLINVLKGEMSLVGPRPPIPYELDRYDTWHRRRVLEIKPGITGLWQVTGRSRTTFDEMVRLDLFYARNWSLWMDLVLLLRTPWAVFRGSGAC